MAGEYLAAIENRSLALKQLTEELFRYTLITANDDELLLEERSVNGILENTVLSFYSVLKEGKIDLHISVPEQQIFRKINENALSRVLENIISNAVKYSDGDLQIALTEKGEIIFSNHASQLTEVQVERLFDRFYTVSSSRKSTGLGLSIAKALVERMGGTVEADFREKILTIRIAFRKE